MVVLKEALSEKSTNLPTQVLTKPVTMVTNGGLNLKATFF